MRSGKEPDGRCRAATQPNALRGRSSPHFLGACLPLLQESQTIRLEPVAPAGQRPWRNPFLPGPWRTFRLCRTPKQLTFDFWEQLSLLEGTMVPYRLCSGTGDSGFHKDLLQAVDGS